MATLPQPYYTPEEYLTLERAAEYKSEYLAGEIYAMSGASLRHISIVANIVAILHNQFRGRSCWVLASDMRVKVAASGLYTYPDVVAICGAVQLEDAHGDTLLNPTVLFEVLSPSTETYDRGKKFAHYRRLESLRDYVLVAQDQVHVEHYTRQPGGWMLTEAADPADTIALPSVGADLALAAVYDRVEFPGGTVAEPLSGSVNPAQ